MRWLPRLWLTDSISCDSEGELEGPLLCLAWHGWVIELAVLRRTRLVTSACTCQAYPTHCANDCPLHGLDDEVAD